MSKFSPTWFGLVFCLCYPLFLTLDWHLFLYYPLHGQWSLESLPESAGPAMQWYGLTVAAALAGGAAGLILTDGNAARAMSRWVWAIAVTSIAACVYLLRGFFA